MNGFSDRGLDEDNFGSSRGISVKSFDAFPKTKPSYLTRSSSGGAWTLLLIVTSFSLLISETRRWFQGTTQHSFSVEKGVSHTLQMNIDIVVRMLCNDLRINVNDAAGDHVIAGEILKKEHTQWRVWDRRKHGLQSIAEKQADAGGVDAFGRGLDEDVHDYLGATRGRRKFPRGPWFRGPSDSCRIYGSLDGNKVQGDFHITARGHGYGEPGEHLSHDTFNFTHRINELSFGPYYPNLQNPLDDTSAHTEAHFHKFQYYLSIVPTIYTEDPSYIRNPDLIPPDPDALYGSSAARRSSASSSRRTVWTNQYAVTEQGHAIPEYEAPGIFVKYDIEPVLLFISEETGSALALVMRLVNVIAGVLVAGGWCFQLTDWAQDALGKRQGKRQGMGVLGGGAGGKGALD